MPDNAYLEGKANLLRLARAVLEASKNGRIEWKEAEGEDGFFTILAGRALTIRSDDRDASHPFSLWVAESGQVLETINTVGESAALGQAFPDWQVLVAELYTEARNRGTRVNQVIDEMLQDLSQKQQEDDIPF